MQPLEIDHKSKKENKLDQGLSMFFRQYRYEILASLFLVALIGGIVLSAIILRQDDSTDEYSVKTEEVTQVEADSLEILVDIAGAVHNPGVYSLAEDSRVVDALEEAGGLTDDADSEWVAQFVNMADKLADGQKLYFPVLKNDVLGIEDGSLEPASSALNLININTATKTELISLPGIGESYAQRIINARPFKVKEDLLKVSGIGTKKFTDLKDKIVIY